MAIPAKDRMDFLASMLRTDSCKMKRKPLVSPKLCPVCNKAYDTWQDGRTFGHSYEDDYGSSKTSYCVDYSAQPRGYLYTVHKIPIY